MNWQKKFVNKIVKEVGLTYTDAMQIMGIVCDVRLQAYMEGFDRGFDEKINKKQPNNDTNKTTNRYASKLLPGEGQWIGSKR